MKMTPWFCALKQPPLRVGWYLCRNSPAAGCDALKYRRYWNGRHWLANGPRTRRVAFGTWTDANEWRGLTQRA